MDAAQRIAAILGNSQQQLRSGPQTQDLTPESMRRVTPAVRKYQLQGVDFREGDPDYRKARFSNTQERQAPKQISSVQTQQSPQQSESSLKVSSGQFTDVTSRGDSVSVGLRVQQTGKLLTIDGASGEMVGKNLRLESSDDDASYVRFFLEDRGNELVLKLSLDVAALAERVTEIQSSVTERRIEGQGPTFAPAPEDPTEPEEETPCSTGTATEVVVGAQCVGGNLQITTTRVNASSCG